MSTEATSAETVNSFMVKMGEDLGENALQGKVIGAILISIQANGELQVQHVGVRTAEVIGCMEMVKTLVLTGPGQAAKLPGHS